MKIFHNYTIILGCVCLMSACNNKPTEKQQVKEQLEESIITIDKLQEKASRDSQFANSKEYAAEMEKVSIEIAKKRCSLPDNEKLLIEFESSLKVLKLYSDRLKKDPSLAKKSSYMRIVEEKTSKVRDYQQTLKKANLNASEKKKFEELEHQ
jgi:hypothetical protein